MQYGVVCSLVKQKISKRVKAIVHSFAELEWISINLSKSAVISLQILENNLTSA